MIGNTSLFDKHKNNLILFFVFILISNNVYSDNMIIDDIENSSELYKKISGDEPVKNFIFKLLYENYQKSMSKLEMTLSL